MRWLAGRRMAAGRYMYVPLGGRDRGWLNVWPIFLFVAVWHDIEPKLMLWGALNAGFYVIEVSLLSSVLCMLFFMAGNYISCIRSCLLNEA